MTDLSASEAAARERVSAKKAAARTRYVHASTVSQDAATTMRERSGRSFKL